MKISTDRILTSHVGSLPRPDDAVALLLRKERGEPYNQAEFDRVMRRAVADIVKHQAEIGIDVVSDGETSKIGYSTYIKDRLNGFGTDEYTPKVHLDVADYPDFRKRMAAYLGTQPFRRLTCVGPISVKNTSEAAADIANFRAALDATPCTDGFLNAASPGVASAFLPNRHYPSHEAYIGALAEALRPEYEAIAKAGFVLQVDCPDLAMSRHTGFQELTEAEFLKRAAFHVEVLNHMLANIPAAQVRIHICWGNYEGPHDHDIPLAKILPIVLTAKAQGISLEAANPRHAHEWAVWRDAKLPDDKVLIPGLIDSSTNYVEHPELVAQRIERYAGAVGRERVIAGTDCGFGTFAGYSKVDPGIAFKKLRSLVEGAAIASKRLWN
jgi:5-methyltetrahydropteroyltriglutamate--homocysteine methyltransferase